VSLPIPNDVALLAQAGNKEAMGLMVPRLLDKAKFVAQTYSATHFDLRDLVQDALLGALDALASWDPTRSSFETYSQNAMRPAINEALGDYYLGASIPRETLKRYWGARQSTETLEEAREALTGIMKPETFVAVHRIVTGTKPAHLVEGVGFEGSVNGEEGSDSFYYAQNHLGATERDLVDRLILEDHLEVLCPREWIIIEGFLRGDSDTEMAQDLGLNRSTISANRRQALSKLKESIMEVENRE
jgi:RNA polymerase sigma factor (sigma-70 family)